MEEMNLAVEIGDHIYTTDYYQQSAFNAAHQIISIYYFAKALEPIKVPLRSTPFDFDEDQLAVYNTCQQTETFRFINANEFTADDVSLPIDKVVVNLLKQSNHI